MSRTALAGDAAVCSVSSHVDTDMCISGWGGGLSDQIVVPRAAVWPLPTSVPLEIGGG